MFKLGSLFGKGNVDSSYGVASSVQGLIPVVRMYEDGMFELKNKRFSMTYRFSDINYATASAERKGVIYENYCDFLNSTSHECEYKITIVNRKIDEKSIIENACVPLNNDNLDHYREEYNQMLVDSVMNKSPYVQEKYITVTTHPNMTLEAARTFFEDLSENLHVNFIAVRSVCKAISLEDRLRLIHDFYNDRRLSNFDYNPSAMQVNPNHFKNEICPERADLNNPNYIQLGEDRFVQTLFIKNYPNKVYYSFVDNLVKTNKEMFLSITFSCEEQVTAIQMADKILFGIESNVAKWKNKQNKAGNFGAQVPIQYEEQRQYATDFLLALKEEDQRMTEAIITISLISDSVEDLKRKTKDLQARVASKTGSLAILNYQQLDAMLTTIPFGPSYLDYQKRVLLTEALGIFMPFRVQDMIHSGGSFWGQNAESGALILLDQSKLATSSANVCVLGASGSGKSFLVKTALLRTILDKDKDADLIILDPEREYGKFVHPFGGEVVVLSQNSTSYINPLDINSYYNDDGDPIALKVDFMVSFCERLAEGPISPYHKTIVDRCTRIVLEDYVNSGYRITPPTLKDFYNCLLAQNENEALQLAQIIELYIGETFPMFSNQTNVDVNNRIICYDLYELNKNMTSVAMLVMLDNILNRITKNRFAGKETYLVVDEAWLLLSMPNSAEFLLNMAKKIRKYHGYLISISQQCEDFLESSTGNALIANSEIVVMLKQKTTRSVQILANMYNLSEEQQKYIKGTGEEFYAGDQNLETVVKTGIIRVSGTVIPFANHFDTNMDLFRFMDTTHDGKEYKPNNQVVINQDYYNEGNNP